MLVRRRMLLAGGLAAAGLAGLAGYRWLAGGWSTPEGTPPELRIATGPPGAVFREIGAALAGVLTERLPDTTIRLVPTDASVENLTLLRDGAADLCFAALDTVTDLIDRTDPSGLAAVARLFDSWMQVLVLADSPVTRLTHLDGVPVAAGVAGSGTRFGLARLVETVGVAPVLVTADQDEGASALARRRVQALVTFTGVPTPAVLRLAATTALRLLPLAAESYAMTDRFGDIYAAATLPSTTYPRVAGAATLTTSNLLLVRPGLSAPLVRAITAELYGRRARIARRHPEADQINVRAGAGTMPVRLHPGARQYYRDVKP